MALLSAEVETVAASSMIQEVIYVRKFLDNIGFPQEKRTPIYEDNRSCVA